MRFRNKYRSTLSNHDSDDSEYVISDKEYLSDKEY